MIICHLYTFRGEVSVKVFGLFLIRLFGCAFYYCCILRVLCIFWIQVLNQIRVLQIFSPICGLSSHLLTPSFTEQKFFILMKRSLSILSFMDRAFGVVSEKVITKPKVT